LSYDALAMLTAPGASCLSSSAALCPQAVALDVAPNVNSDAALRRIAAANPDGTVGGTYEQPVSRAADIRNYDQMGSLPVALAALLAAAAATAFLLTVLATIRARRRDLAILRTLGLTTPQIRKTVIAQTLITVFAALIVGVPLGILVGRVTWIRFAGDIGLITTPTVPILLVVVIIAAAGVTCGAFALIPAAVATRTPAAGVLHTE
jgi:putative ABC transport system permease protein